ncbi:hypothetical protein F5Y16DRAFT_378439 [Xylariaceae sp. FL0255]|nr:hypothetical protein F5Y16DRAFT_378439 [Xylariaceae sp. FL0255]
MDPVSAFGLAASVVQFLTFTQSILSKATEIHNSVNGQPTDLASIVNIYEHLQSFSVRFTSQASKAADIASSTHTGVDDAQEISALINILQGSKADCDHIIGLVNKLNVGAEPRRSWKSFKAALELVWNRREIEELDKRLQRAQSAVTLHMCAMTSRLHGSYRTEFQKARDACSLHHISHGQKIEDVFEILRTIESRYFPPRPGRGENRMTPDNVPPVQSQDIEMLGQQVAKLSLISQSISMQQSIIKSLNFEHRPMRYNRIPIAHKETFAWVHDPDTRPSGPTSGLLDWLRKKPGIFWVSGKPGSGKSTFMKYLEDDERTRRALDDWASPYRVLIASHYFWNAGTTMQKSQKGLLQEILLKIFRSRPELIESICVERVEDSTIKSHDRPQRPWSTAELSQALQRLAESADDIKICLFIDGLDEYSGDHHEFCQDLLKIIQSGNIKMCLSSRSWNVFEDAFGQYPTLRIHHLTRADTRAYVTSILSEHPRWVHLHDQPTSGDHLINEVVERADGVFLWVSMVTRLLREGLSNDDSSTDLLKRLKLFPTELEPFFKHMLDSVEPFYYPKMSGCLQIAIASRNPLFYPIYSFHEDEYDDSDYALKLAARNKGFQALALTRLHHKVSRRLNGHCKGLLEVGNSRVTFLHRTVADFLKTREMGDYLVAKGLPNFDAKLSILKALLAFIKTYTTTITQRLTMCDHPVGQSIVDIHTHIKLAISVAAELEMESSLHNDIIETILDDMEISLCSLNGKAQVIHPLAGRSWEEAPKTYIRANILRYGLTEYTKRKITQDLGYLDEFDQPPLSILAHPDNQEIPRGKVHNALKLLLEDGEDPNEVYTSESPSDYGSVAWTPWTFFLSQAINVRGVFDYTYHQKLNEKYFLTYLEHGADRNARIFRSVRNGTAQFSVAWVDFLLLSVTTDSVLVTESAYLDVLDAFLGDGVNMCDTVYVTNSGETQTVHEAFFSGIRQQTQLRQVYAETAFKLPQIRQLRLWRTITSKLLAKGHSQDWPSDDLWVTLSDIFGSEQQKAIRTQYELSCAGNEAMPGLRRKRKYRGRVNDHETTYKLPRLES